MTVGHCPMSDSKFAPNIEAEICTVALKHMWHRATISAKATQAN